MAKNVRTVKTINASPSEVWHVLTDFEKYAEWNPFIVEGAGSADVGSRLRLVMRNGNSRMIFRPTVTIAHAGQTLEWLGHLVLPGIFDGRHRFDLTPTTDGTQLVQSERFTGLLTVLMGSLERDVTENFRRLNDALAERVTAVRR